MKALKRIAATLAVVILWLAVLVLAVDALEYETTGECRDCIILNR